MQNIGIHLMSVGFSGHVEHKSYSPIPFHSSFIWLYVIEKRTRFPIEFHLEILVDMALLCWSNRLWRSNVSEFLWWTLSWLSKTSSCWNPLYQRIALIFLLFFDINWFVVFFSDQFQTKVIFLFVFFHIFQIKRRSIHWCGSLKAFEVMIILIRSKQQTSIFVHLLGQVRRIFLQQ